jgi:hypothetical protein
LLILAALLTGFALHTMASFVADNSNPSYAHPTTLRIALSVGLAACILWIARLWKAETPPVVIWFWPAFFAVLAAAFLPGLSPYFIFPLLVAMPLLLIAAFVKSAPLRDMLFGLAAIPSLFVWFGMAAQGEGVMGLMLHPLFTLSSILAITGFVPLLRLDSLSRKAWVYASGALSVAAILLAVLTGLQPTYSPQAPQRLNLAYVEDHTNAKSYWSADALTPALRQSANFSEAPRAALPFNLLRGYVADAGAPKFSPPRLEVLSDTPTPSGRIVKLSLSGSAQIASLNLSVPASVKPHSAIINGREMAAPSGDMLIACLGNSCNGTHVTLTLGATAPFDIFIAEQRQGLPPDGEKLSAARGTSAVPSQTGDVTIVLSKARVP